MVNFFFKRPSFSEELKIKYHIYAWIKKLSF